MNKNGRKMKKKGKGVRRITAVLLAVLIAVTCAFVPKKADTANAASGTEKRACWIAYLDIEKYLRDQKEADFRRYFTNMCNNAVNNNLNTLIVQVRAMSDAIYPSDYYPWSKYISSNGTDPGYDPLAIMVEIAHSKGLKLEAWINPYRITNRTDMTVEVQKSVFYQQHSGDIIEYTAANERCLMLDPAKDGARQLIVNGVKEIVSNYNVDGIHLDDYFYVSGMGDNVSVDARKANVNQLIRGLYQTIKAIRPSCELGISPAGNLANARNAGADVDTWLSAEGYIDYLMPQIYWSDNYKMSGKYTTLFTNRAKEWMSLNKNGTDMYVGLALYRVGTVSSTDKGWSDSSDNLKKQYLTSQQYGYKGYALFRYAWFDEAGAKTELANLKSVIMSSNTGETGVSYNAHIQSFGWQQPVSNGKTQGTVGLGKRMEALSIQLTNINGGVTYRSHVQSYGWMNWVSDGAISGTEGEAKRVEAVQIKLTGEAAETYDIYYRVHAQSYGWLGWAKNGEPAGTSTYGKRLEAIEIRLVEKGKDAPVSDKQPYISRNVKYTSHVQSYGWQQDKYDGELSGTTGKAKRLEGIKISLTNINIPGGITYRTHVQSYGWQPWVFDGAMSGTSGEAKRLEAIEIKLTGEAAELYDVCYRVHVQTYGWQDWKKNGETAGTEGQAKRLESIEIKIVPKGENP